MGIIRGDRWRGVSEEGDNNKNIHAIRWEVYVKQEEDLIKSDFSVFIPHLKGGNIVWTCVKYQVINENEQYKAI